MTQQETFGHEPVTDEKPLPWCPCPPTEDIHQESCPRYQELLRREQAWRDGAHPAP